MQSRFGLRVRGTTYVYVWRGRRLVQSRSQALGKGSLRIVVGEKKQRLRCVPVSHPGNPVDVTGLFAGTSYRREKRLLGFDTILDNPAPRYSSVPASPLVVDFSASCLYFVTVFAKFKTTRRFLSPK